LYSIEFKYYKGIQNSPVSRLECKGTFIYTTIVKSQKKTSSIYNQNYKYK